ncbi:MAG TPA: DNA topoisomerase IB [Burkholderiaceae bacterium]|nr:DNA topoisomerase IB [Burkholderiaceae bacterium]
MTASSRSASSGKASPEKGPVASAAALALAAAVEQDLIEEAQQLVYVDDGMPGWTRVKRGDDFEYLDHEGRGITDEDELRRIRRLAIPPAYTAVWICPIAEGHIQATARDARGRKQYRYHPVWLELRGVDKYERLRDFGHALPRIRRAVQRDLARDGLPAAKVLATIVRLLDTTYLRVGNDEYVRENGSYGLTTLRNRHAKVKGGVLRLSFRGKSGVQQRVELEDKRVARIVKKLQELPGQELFQYVDEDGQTRSVGSSDVNAYLRRISGGDFTAKDFRTWHASALALEHLHGCEPCGGNSARQRVKEVIATVAQRLGHTQAVCRKSYVHPQVLQAFVEGRLHAVCAKIDRRVASIRGLKGGERRLLALLQPPRGGAARLVSLAAQENKLSDEARSGTRSPSRQRRPRSARPRAESRETSPSPASAPEPSSV